MSPLRRMHVAGSIAVQTACAWRRTEPLEGLAGEVASTRQTPDKLVCGANFESFQTVFRCSFRIHFVYTCGQLEEDYLRMRWKKFWQFQNLESRRMLAAAIGDLDNGLAPYAQQATHVVGGAWLGDQIGHTIPLTDRLTDRLFEPEVAHGPIRLGGGARQTLIADVNGDTLPDLVTFSYDHLLTQLRQVDGTYAERVYTDLTSYSDDSHCYAEAFTLSDTNGDGKHEAIIPCHSSLLVLSADQQGSFNNLLFLDLRYVPTDVVKSADINDDGIADFIFLSYQGISETVVYVGDGNGSLSRVPFTETVAALVTQAHLEDANDDGFDRRCCHGGIFIRYEFNSLFSLDR